MLDWLSENLGGIPVAGVIAVLCLGLVQLCLQVVALVHWFRRRTALEYAGLWLVLVVLGGIVGAVLYLLLAQRTMTSTEPQPAEPQPTEPQPTAPAKAETDAALDLLYGDEEGG